MNVFVNDWIDLSELIAEELAHVEQVGIFGTLTVGFVAAAVLSGVTLAPLDAPTGAVTSASSARNRPSASSASRPRLVRPRQ